MCLGGGKSPKVETPKPSPLPPPPKPTPVAPKKLVEPDAKPDIRIGAAKKSTRSGRNRGLSIGGGSSGSNQGLNL